RDCVATRALMLDGWTVLRFWESEIYKNLEQCVDTTMSVIERGVKASSFSLVPEKSFAEFFAGIGLMRMGLELEGWSVSLANDLDEQKYEMYKGQFAGAEDHFLVEDIHKLRGERVPSVTLATASFPCNDLSLAGARAGLRGDQSSAFWGFVRILKEMGE